MSGFLADIAEYNEAVMTEVPFDPVCEGRGGTAGLAVRKSNWANRLDKPPFVAFQVTCGITFTFGGLRITPDKAAVVSNEGVPIRGLYAAGEIVGGLFFHNYPGGTGPRRVPHGRRRSVFGRIAGESGRRAQHGADRQRSARRQRLRERLISADDGGDDLPPDRELLGHTRQRALADKGAARRPRRQLGARGLAVDPTPFVSQRRSVTDGSASRRGELAFGVNMPPCRRRSLSRRRAGGRRPPPATTSSRTPRRATGTRPVPRSGTFWQYRHSTSRSSRRCPRVAAPARRPCAVRAGPEVQ